MAKLSKTFVPREKNYKKSSLGKKIVSSIQLPLGRKKKLGR